MLGLPHEAQERLLLLAERERWTSRELERRVRSERTSGTGRRGRPPLPAFVRSVHQIAKLVESPHLSFGDLDAVDRLNQEEARRLYRTVTAMMTQCAIIRDALAAQVDPDTGHPILRNEIIPLQSP